jgi:hypothetical protein
VTRIVGVKEEDMRIRLFVPSLLVVVLSSIGASLATAKQSKIIYLVAKDSGAKIATIHVNGENLLLRVQWELRDNVVYAGQLVYSQ